MKFDGWQSVTREEFVRAIVTACAVSSSGPLTDLGNDTFRRWYDVHVRDGVKQGVGFTVERNGRVLGYFVAATAGAL